MRDTREQEEQGAGGAVAHLGQSTSVTNLSSGMAMYVYTSSTSFSACSIMKVNTEESSRWFAWGEEQSWEIGQRAERAKRAERAEGAALPAVLQD